MIDPKLERYLRQGWWRWHFPMRNYVNAFGVYWKYGDAMLAEGLPHPTPLAEATLIAKFEEYHSAALLIADLGGDDPATLRSAVWKSREGQDHGPGQTWKEYAEMLEQESDEMEKEIEGLKAEKRDSQGFVGHGS